MQWIKPIVGHWRLTGWNNSIELYDGLLQMKIPDDIGFITEELCRDKFPYRKRPDYIVVNSQSNVFLTASRYPKELHKENIFNALLEIKGISEQAVP